MRSAGTAGSVAFAPGYIVHGVTAPVPVAALSKTVPITTQAVYSAMMDHLFQAPLLLEPEPDAQLQSAAYFQWQWEGPSLPEGLAFDLLIWSEAEDQVHGALGANGVVAIAQLLERSVDLDYVETIVEHGGGTYYWTVIAVQEEPYERVGVWGEKRPFTYAVPQPPDQPQTQSP